MNIKKICLIIPSLRNGGSERVMSELANIWSKNDTIKVFLILLTNQEQFYKIDSRITIIIPNKKYKKNIISKSVYKIWIFYFIRNICSKIAPDAILSFGERYNNLVIISLLFKKNNLYVSDRNSPYLNIGIVNNILRKILYKNVSGIIAQTQTALEVLSKSTKNPNIRVIPNPLRDISILGFSEKNQNKRIILNVGRNVTQKNQLELIEIFSQCNFENWILKILGNGPLKEKMIDKVKSLELENHVFILDFDRDIDNFYSEATIFAFTSLYEGFPNALNEALAHGLASISYDCPTGPRDIIQNGKNGYLIPLGDKVQYKQKLIDLMTSEETRTLFGAEAKKVKELYSLQTISGNYLDFITKT